MATGRMFACVLTLYIVSVLKKMPLEESLTTVSLVVQVLLRLAHS